jgi:hypothetical protein
LSSSHTKHGSVKRYNSPAILFLDKDGPLVTFENYLEVFAALKGLRSIISDWQHNGQPNYGALNTALAIVDELLTDETHNGDQP